MAKVAQVALLGKLREWRRSRRRFSASILSTYTVNLPFYEDVVLRDLEGTGSRLNVLLADASQLAMALKAESTRPRRAGTDYLLLPMQAAAAFHPKIFALLGEKGMVLAVGSHNLTESGYGRNGEICAAFGFDRDPAPSNISRTALEFLLACAKELAPGDASLNRRLSEKLLGFADVGADLAEQETFIHAAPGSGPLLDRGFTPAELKASRRILVLGPYFDDDMRFILTLRKRAPRAEIVIAVQPDHVVMKRPNLVPANTRLVQIDALFLKKLATFIHAKAVVLDTGKERVLAIGSANPSGRAWLGEGLKSNYEAVVFSRGTHADRAIKELGLDRFWDAATITSEQRELIATRSTVEAKDGDAPARSPISGLWRGGWVHAALSLDSDQVRSLSIMRGATTTHITHAGAVVVGGILRFPAPEAGVYTVGLVALGPQIVIASSAIALASSLTSGTSGRLIDELHRLGDGATPGDELLNLCERVLLEPDGELDKQELGPARKPSDRRAVGVDDARLGPRGISIRETETRSQVGVSVGLDISAIITLLLKDLEAPPKEHVDPTSEDEDEIVAPETDFAPPDGPTITWDDVVRAVRPRVRRVLKRLAARIEEEHSAKWKYERVLLILALMKRLRRFHPGDGIPFSGSPDRLVDQQDVREAFKMAMRTFFSREMGVLAALEKLGGVDSEHEMIGRALLLWAAYEAGVDARLPPSFSLETSELHALQGDRTDAIVSAIAASASEATLERAHREISDRGSWHDRPDRRERVETWFARHSKIGQAFHVALTTGRHDGLPVLDRAPSMQDILIWRSEPGWPRLPQLVAGRVVHLADVGDAEPLRIKAEFVHPLDVDALDIGSAFATASSR